MATQRIVPYTQLITSFVQGEIPVTEFETEYLQIYQADASQFSEGEFRILDALFGDVDAFCADTTLRDVNDLDEVQLREHCQRALQQLQHLAPKRTLAMRKAVA